MYHKKIIFIILYIFLIAAGSTLAQNITIDEAVKRVLENNLDLKAAKLNIYKEEAVKLRSFNIPRPELFIEYEGIKGGLKNFESRKIGILQELEFPTNYFLRSDVQSSQVEIARYESEKIAVNIKYDVKSVYLNLMLNKKLLEAARENLKIYEDFLFTAEKKFEAGSTGNLEVLGAKVRKIKYENEIRNIESEIIKSRSELQKLINVPDLRFELADELVYRKFIINKNELLKKALSNNPEINISKFQKEKFSNKLSLSRSWLLPNFSFRYYTQKIGNDAGFWGMELGIGLPVWFWWEQTGTIKEAGFELDIAAADELISAKNIENDVNLVFEEYENSTRETEFFNNEAVPESGEILRQAMISYREGAIDYVEYLQALQIVYDTRTQYLRSLFTYYSSIFKLEKLIAGEIK